MFPERRIGRNSPLDLLLQLPPSNDVQESVGPLDGQLREGIEDKPMSLLFGKARDDREMHLIPRPLKPSWTVGESANVDPDRVLDHLLRRTTDCDQAVAREVALRGYQVGLLPE